LIGPASPVSAQRRGAPIEKKHTYFGALDGKPIGVGYYNR
jgi:hypothetical protein